MTLQGRDDEAYTASEVLAQFEGGPWDAQERRVPWQYLIKVHVRRCFGANPCSYTGHYILVSTATEVSYGIYRYGWASDPRFQNQRMN